MAIASLCLVVTEFCRFHSIEIKCKLTMVIDNLTAIKRLNQIRLGIDVRKYHANADALSIIAACPEVVARLTPSHVKSHQDKKKHPSKLPHDARTNILCDRLCNLYLENIREGEWVPQHVPLRPHSLPIELKIEGKVILSHYTKRLHEEIGDDRHQDYVRTKFKWNAQTYAYIDWESIERVANKVTLTQMATVSKLAHNWLPLGQRRQLMESDAKAKEEASKCPCCLKAVETFGHMLSCPDQRLQKARFEALEELRKDLKYHPAGRLMVQAIKHWTQYPTKPMTLKSTRLNQSLVDEMVDQQNAIGWPNLFRGYVSQLWGYISLIPILHEPKNANKIRHQLRRKAQTFNTTAIQALQTYSLALYAKRNDILHSGDDETEHIVHVRLNNEIKQLYEDKEKFSQSDKVYFSIPIEKILRRTSRGRRRWLYLARLVASRAYERVTIGQQVLNTYFSRQESIRPKKPFVEPVERPTITYHQTSLTGFYDRPVLSSIIEEINENDDND